MPEPTSRPRPWLVAAWPGMGNVAVIAGSYLIQRLGMTQSRELPLAAHFDVNEVEVKNGLVVPPRLPRGAFFTWKNPGRGRDLIVFISSAQPSVANFAYAQRLLDAAAGMDVERVVTFASLASGLHPSEHPKVSGVATDAATLAELRRAEVTPIEGGQIGGLNGLIIGIAADRGIAGICLMAEIPYFAMNVPNPKAARAALSVFSVLAGIDISLTALDEQAAIVDRALVEAMEKAEREPPAEAEEEAEPNGGGEASASAKPAAEKETPRPRAASLSQADRAEIEELFEKVRKDPSQGVALKQELDRLGVFEEYEGRFLDLFRRAG